jgi:ankyrin repeat protein
LTNYSDDDDDLDDSVSARENYRLAPQVTRTRRRNSTYSTAQQQRASASNKSDVLFIQARLPGKISVPEKHSSFLNSGYISMIDQQAAAAARSSKESRGQTLLHLAARLGHDEILRLLICETSQAGMLMNARGQTPLLTAIEAGSTSAATLLMESDPRSIIVSDDNGSSVFHYACEHCNDIVLNRAIALLKRLNSTSDRITVSFFSNLFEKFFAIEVY